MDGGFILRVGRLTCIPTDLFFFFSDFLSAHLVRHGRDLFGGLHLHGIWRVLLFTFLRFLYTDSLFDFLKDWDSFEFLVRDNGYACPTESYLSMAQGCMLYNSGPELNQTIRDAPDHTLRRA